MIFCWPIGLDLETSPAHPARWQRCETLPRRRLQPLWGSKKISRGIPLSGWVFPDFGSGNPSPRGGRGEQYIAPPQALVPRDAPRDRGRRRVVVRRAGRDLRGGTWGRRLGRALLLLRCLLLLLRCLLLLLLLFDVHLRLCLLLQCSSLGLVLAFGLLLSTVKSQGSSSGIVTGLRYHV